jgi:indolepyruvate ferredoxin oxidoreductase beta subunit
MGIAQRLGTPLVVSTVLLGVLSKYLEFPLEKWKEVLARLVPEKHREVNLEAFEEGRQI